jgi:hypothetical protein
MSAAFNAMFVSRPQYEFLFPPGLEQHWRMVELTLHAPWFLLSIEVDDPDSEIGFVRTIAFIWENDFLDYLAAVDVKRVRGLVCMAPGWTSQSGGWTSHDVLQVWTVLPRGGGRFIRLRGTEGQWLEVGLSEPDEAGESALLLDFKARPPAKSPGRQPRSRKS